MAKNYTRLSTSVTVAQYMTLQAADDRFAASVFVKERFDERYLSPVLDVAADHRHGFSMMALACLTIEALQAFRLGYEHTRGKSEKVFGSFFASHAEFDGFAGDSWFYNHIRCGLLHDAEARGGWHIRRSGPLLSAKNRSINATHFLRALRRAVYAYADELISDDDLWALFKKKMEQVLRNCEA